MNGWLTRLHRIEPQMRGAMMNDMHLPRWRLSLDYGRGAMLMRGMSGEARPAGIA